MVKQVLNFCYTGICFDDVFPKSTTTFATFTDLHTHTLPRRVPGFPNSEIMQSGEPFELRKDGWRALEISEDHVKS